MKWLKLYTGIATDPKVGILSFDDRWHYVSLLCAKADGLMDEEPRLRDRLLRVHLGLSEVEMGNVKDRLIDVCLITAEWEIYGWDEKQSADATGAARKRRQRAREKVDVKTKEIRSKNKEESVTVTGQSRDTYDHEILFDKCWSCYPRKVGKSPASKAFKKLTEKEHQLILKDIKKRDFGTDEKFIPHLTTYLNQRRWEDESAPTKESIAYV